MKKIFIVIMFVLSFNLFSQGLNPYCFVAFNYYPIYEETYFPKYEKIFGSDIGIGIEFKGFYIQAHDQIYMLKLDKFYFSPFREKYFFEIGFSFNIINIEFEHMCLHEISRKQLYFEQYNKISITFDTRNIKENKWIKTIR